MDVNEQISQVMTGVFSEDSPLGPITVRETEGTLSHYSSDSKSRSGYVFVVQSDAMQNNPAVNAPAIEAHIMSKLKGKEPFKSNLTLESERAHSDRLADELEFFRLQETELNKKTTGTSLTTIPDKYPQWFKELSKRPDWNLKHAWSITKQDDGVIILTANVPTDIDPEIIVANYKAELVAKLEGLGKRTAKYSTRTDKEALEAEVKALHVDIKASSQQNSKQITIEIMPQERFDDMNQPGGAKPEKAAIYAAKNPLMTLQNGDDDKDPEKPQPHLQKALVRSFSLTGEKAYEVFHLIAGKEDMHREVGKSLTKMKKRITDNPESLGAEASKQLVERIDKFLNDDVFKSREYDKPAEEQPNLKDKPNFTTQVIEVEENGVKTKKTVLRVSMDFPTNDIGKIQEQILALGNNPTVAPALGSVVDAAPVVPPAGVEANVAVAAAGASTDGNEATSASALAAGMAATKDVSLGAVSQPPFKTTTTPPAVAQALAGAGASISPAA